MIWIALTIVASVGAGVAAERRHGERAQAFARRSLTVMLYVLVPPVVYFNLVGLELDADVGLGLVCAWVAVIVTGLIAYAVATRGLQLDRPQTGALVNASIHPNTGYFGLPIVAAVLGTDQLSQAVAYDVLVGTVTLLVGVFSIGAAFGTTAGETPGERAKAFVSRNPPLLVALLALISPDVLAPDVLVDASRILVFALLPLGFLAVGITLAHEAHETGAASPSGVAIGTEAPPRASFPPPMTRRIAAALVLRLVLAPALLFAIAAPLIDLPDAYLILAAMPTGLNGLVVAHAYGLDVRYAASVVAWSTSIVLVVGLIATAVA